MVSKQLFATTIKLSGTNYLLWAQSFDLFLCSQKKLKHIKKILSKEHYYLWWLSYPWLQCENMAIQ